MTIDLEQLKQAGDVPAVSLDWNASFEWLADQFYGETGLMAPGKDDPMCSDMEERRSAWCEWMKPRSEQAWREWHENHGMLYAAAPIVAQQEAGLT